MDKKDDHRKRLNNALEYLNFRMVRHNEEIKTIDIEEYEELLTSDEEEGPDNMNADSGEGLNINIVNDQEVPAGQIINETDDQD